MTVFNIDDDSDDREIFRDAVDTVNPQIACVQFENGMDALQFLDKCDTYPDYLFIDMNMPKMTGLECVDKIRSIPHFSGIRIVMYSTAFSPNNQLYFSAMGIQCLLKQSRFTDIVSSLERILSNEIPVLAE